MKVLLAVLVLGLAVGGACAQNIIPNGGFEVDTDDDGMADQWSFSGNESVKVEWSRDEGVEGDFSQKLDCSEFDYTSPSSHVMLAMNDAFALEGGEWYTLTFQVKGENISGSAAEVAIQQTGPWENLGCQAGFRVTPDWREVETSFRASKTVSENLRLQIWFGSTGTIWIDDVRMVASDAPLRRYTEVLPDLGSKNLIPNSSFECGESGWGSITDTPGWGGNMSFLHGEIDRDTSAAHASSMRIPVDRETGPVYFFDYFEMARMPVLKPLLANRGWVSVETGKEYTLSASIKSTPAGVPCVMKVYHAFAGQPVREDEASTDWQRVTLTFAAQSPQLHIAIGPDLTESDIEAATLWVDAVQLEQSPAATDYEPRAPVEVGVTWEAPGHLFSAPADVRATVTAYNTGAEPASVKLSGSLTDFHDGPAGEAEVTLEVPAGEAAQQVLRPEVSSRGFYRMALECQGGALVPTRPERFAVIEPCEDDAGLFGMNHAYPWARLNGLSKQIGLTWFRDWSLKWLHVEPEKGRFDFTEADRQIDRVLDLGINVLPLLPFPSSNWASTAPADVGEDERYPAYRERAAFMPRDLGEFQDYVRTTVRHYQGRLSVWEILNEPIYTSYALPSQRGYEAADYVKLLQSAYEAVKEVDPEALVIGGIAGHPSGLTKEFIEAGGLEYIDAINLHAYPGLKAPEAFIEPLQTLNARMADAGKKRPIWFTEGAYYADDDTPTEPFQSWMSPMETEAECAAYLVRLDIILLGHGAEKIIYHSGTPGAVNNEGMAGIFFEWEGAPRKMAAAQAQLTALLGPDTVSLGSVSDEVHAYAFHSRGKTVVALWNDSSEERTLDVGGPATVVDICGKELEGGVPVTGAPCYVVLEDEVGAQRLARGLAEWVE